MYVFLFYNFSELVIIDDEDVSPSKKRGRSKSKSSKIKKSKKIKKEVLLFNYFLILISHDHVL